MLYYQYLHQYPLLIYHIEPLLKNSEKLENQLNHLHLKYQKMPRKLNFWGISILLILLF